MFHYVHTSISCIYAETTLKTYVKFIKVVFCINTRNYSNVLFILDMYKYRFPFKTLFYQYKQAIYDTKFKGEKETRRNKTNEYYAFKTSEIVKMMI